MASLRSLLFAAIVFCLVTTLIAMPLSLSTYDLGNNASMLEQPGHNHSKRYYGVKDMQTAKAEGVQGPWPACPLSDTQMPGQLRFCFLNEDSMDSLSLIFRAAVTKWTQATKPFTGLEIVPAPQCHGRFRCLCSVNGIAEDTLVISSVDKTFTTLGYQYTLYLNLNQPDIFHTVHAYDARFSP
jgi:hypothetical protein